MRGCVSLAGHFLIGEFWSVVVVVDCVNAVHRCRLLPPSSEAADISGVGLLLRPTSFDPASHEVQPRYSHQLCPFPLNTVKLLSPKYFQLSQATVQFGTLA